jgi:hypothetical protein
MGQRDMDRLTALREVAPFGVASRSWEHQSQLSGWK